MSLTDFSSTTILETVNILMEQSSQIFPFQPVEDFMEEKNTTTMCSLLGISPDLVRRFRERGLSVDEADKVACRLGEHPSMIWREWSNITPISDPLFDVVELFMSEHKLCGRCHEWVPLKDFHKRRASKDGLFRYCVPCMKVKDK